MNLPSLSHAFSFLVVAVVVVASLIVMLYLRRRTALAVLAGFAIWVAYVLAIGVSGVAGNYSTIPPGVAIMLVPVFTLVLVTALSPVGRAIAAAIPLAILLGFQVFRILVELTLARLNELGLTPHLMTFSGGNFEIVFAASAPFAAWAASRGGSWRWLIGWNVLGLISLANVASRAVLTAPGPLNLIHAEVPDLGIITYPFTWIPGLMAPLAVLLHVVAIRSIAGRSRAAADPRNDAHVATRNTDV